MVWATQGSGLKLFGELAGTAWRRAELVIVPINDRTRPPRSGAIRGQGGMGATLRVAAVTSPCLSRSDFVSGSIGKPRTRFLNLRSTTTCP